MKSGTVKQWRAKNGFGFITPDDGGPDVFMHITKVRQVAPGLIPGARVHYEDVKGEKGMQATSVRLEHSDEVFAHLCQQNRDMREVLDDAQKILAFLQAKTGPSQSLGEIIERIDRVLEAPHANER